MKIKKIKEKIALAGTCTSLMLASVTTKVFADTTGGQSAINTQQVTDITTKIQNVVKSLAMPIGSVLIFIAVVLTAIRIAIHHNNPKARSEDLGSIGWLVIAGIILGASLIIAGIIINVTSNNGSLF